MSVEINATNFPDESFRNKISAKFDLDHDGVLSDTEIENATSFSIQVIGTTWWEGTSVQGIEFLTALKTLELAAKNITSINVSTLTDLETLNLKNCFNLTSLDVTHNTKLKKLDVYGTSLSSIDLSQNGDLEELSLGNSSNDYAGETIEVARTRSTITSLDISNNSKLKRFSYSNSITQSRLSSLSDLRNNPLLERIEISENCQIASFNLSLCTHLNYFSIWGNSAVRELDFSACPSMTELYLDHIINLQRLEIKNLSHLQKIYGLSNSTNLQEIDVSGCSELKTFEYAGPNDNIQREVAASSINFSGCTSLEEVRTSNNAISNINLSGCTSLKKLICYNNNLSELQISDCQRLEYLVCAKNHNLKSLDLSSFSNIYHVNCDDCDIAQLLLPDNENLSYLKCTYNDQLTYLDISKYPLLIAIRETVSPTNMNSGKYYSGTTNGVSVILSYPNWTEIDTGTFSITQNPSSIDVNSGDTVTFTVVAIGSNLIYSWETKNIHANAWNIVSGADESSYSFEATSSDDKTEYRCMVSNGEIQKYSESAILTVRSEPTIIAHPSSASVTDGAKHTFSVTATGNDLTYRWQSSTDGNTWTDIRYATNHEYEILATLALNGIQYRCTVTNQVGSVNSAAATLSVVSDTSLTAPEISINPTNVTANDGDVATFAVAADGDELTYQWQVQKNGSWQSIYGANEATYTVNATKALDGVSYRCLVANAAGAVYSLSAMLTVISPSYITTPRVLTQPRNSTAALGDLVSFIVRADGGDLTHRWQKLNGGQWYDVTGAIGAIYTLTATSDLDGAQYRCVISNTAGSIATNIVTLTLQDTPALSFYGYHSIIISGKNTYGEWEMYPTSRPHIAPPEVKTSYVDLPGADGGIDYTDLLTGEPRYGYRKGSWEFLLIPQDRWASVYRSLVNFLHGKVHTVILEDDPNYVYTGRLSVNEWQSAAHNSLITIDYILEPFPRNISGEDPSEIDEEALNAAERLLRKPENLGMVIGLVNNTASVIDPAILFQDGDSIAY